MEIWEVIEQKCSPVERSMIQARAADAEALLTQVPKTFPLYTRHDGVHAANVLRLMEDLLGEHGLAELSGLEAGFLALAASFHDVGMVATDEELAKVSNDPGFVDFVKRRPELRLNGFDSDGRPGIDLVENYIRWVHAERAHVRIGEFPAHAFDWGRVPLDRMLGQLCQSHNEDPLSLLDLPTDFLGQADLRMCAVLLRLADILDFDNSRTPEVLYAHLRLDAPRDRREETSRGEWRKHLNSNGFQWPTGERGDPYPIHFGAGPEDPETEHQLRRFLDVIDREVTNTRKVLRGCSARWRDLPLPGPVDRSGIQSRGYKFGEFRFSMDRDSLIQLFMGDRLYVDRGTFLRELLQNALDATRLRALERGWLARDDRLRLSVDLWRGEDGSEWVSFDDQGTGMDEAIVSRYLLSVGTSYYRSAEFEVRSRAAGLEHKITPISEFGIGLLSCFMAGDRVEISTLRQHADGSLGSPVRLSMKDVGTYFVMQTGDLAATPMPRRGGDSPGYRTSPGTTVAVRLNLDGNTDLRALERQFRALLFDPPLQISVNGSAVDDSLPRFIESGLAMSIRPIGNAKENGGNGLTSRNVTVNLEGKDLRVQTIDLTEASGTPQLRGQIVAFSTNLSTTDFSMDATFDRWAERYELGPTARIILESAIQPVANLHLNRRGSAVEFAFKASSPSGFAGHGVGEVLEGADQGMQHRFSFDESGRDPWLGLTSDQLSDLVVVGQSDRDRLGSAFAANDLYFGELTAEGRRLYECMRRENLLGSSSIHRMDREVGSAGASWSLDELGIGDDIARRGSDWAGHNGVALPTRGTTNELSFSGSWGGRGRLWAFFGLVSLSDSLRPVLNVARSDILRLPFETVAAFRLAVRRACFASLDLSEAVRAARALREYPALGEMRGRGRPWESPLRSAPPPTLAEVMRAVRSEDELWRDERLFEVEGRRLSIRDLVGLVQVGPVLLNGHERSSDWLTTDDAESWVARGLVQDSIHVVQEGSQLIATGVRTEGNAALDLIPPLLMCPGSADQVFWPDNPDLPLNSSHPIGQWIENNIEALARISPGRYAKLVGAFVRLTRTRSFDVESAADLLGSELAAIGRQLPQLPAPPDAANLRRYTRRS